MNEDLDNDSVQEEFDRLFNQLMKNKSPEKFPNHQLQVKNIYKHGSDVHGHGGKINSSKSIHSSYDFLTRLRAAPEEPPLEDKGNLSSAGSDSSSSSLMIVPFASDIDSENENITTVQHESSDNIGHQTAAQTEQTNTIEAVCTDLVHGGADDMDQTHVRSSPAKEADAEDGYESDNSARSGIAYRSTVPRILPTVVVEPEVYPGVSSEVTSCSKIISSPQFSRTQNCEHVAKLKKNKYILDPEISVPARITRSTRAKLIQSQPCSPVTASISCSVPAKLTRLSLPKHEVRARKQIPASEDLSSSKISLAHKLQSTVTDVHAERVSSSLKQCQSGKVNPSPTRPSVSNRVRSLRLAQIPDCTLKEMVVQPQRIVDLPVRVQSTCITQSPKTAPSPRRTKSPAVQSKVQSQMMVKSPERVESPKTTKSPRKTESLRRIKSPNRTQSPKEIPSKDFNPPARVKQFMDWSSNLKSIPFGGRMHSTISTLTPEPGLNQGGTSSSDQHDQHTQRKYVTPNLCVTEAPIELHSSSKKRTKSPTASCPRISVNELVPTLTVLQSLPDDSQKKVLLWNRAEISTVPGDSRTGLSINKNLDNDNTSKTVTDSPGKKTSKNKDSLNSSSRMCAGPITGKECCNLSPNRCKQKQNAEIFESRSITRFVAETLCESDPIPKSLAIPSPEIMELNSTQSEAVSTKCANSKSPNEHHRRLSTKPRTKINQSPTKCESGNRGAASPNGRTVVLSGKLQRSDNGKVTDVTAPDSSPHSEELADSGIAHTSSEDLKVREQPASDVEPCDEDGFESDSSGRSGVAYRSTVPKSKEMMSPSSAGNLENDNRTKLKQAVMVPKIKTSLKTASYAPKNKLKIPQSKTTKAAAMTLGKSNGERIACKQKNSTAITQGKGMNSATKHAKPHCDIQTLKRKALSPSSNKKRQKLSMNISSQGKNYHSNVSCNVVNKSSQIEKNKAGDDESGLFKLKWTSHYSLQHLENDDVHSEGRHSVLDTLFSEGPMSGRRTRASQGLANLIHSGSHAGGIWQSIVSETPD